MDLEAVAFDIDGTIYPEWKLYILVFPFILKHFTFMNAFRKVRSEMRVRQEKSGEVLTDFFDVQATMLAGYLKRDKAVIKEELDKVYSGWKSIFSRIKPYGYVLEVVKKLKERGLKIALLSDFLVQQKGDVWGILPYCDVAFGTEEIGALKPSPHPFLALSKALDVQPEKILYVGNSVAYDVVGANAVGMKTALIRKGCFFSVHSDAKKANIVFSDYRQLLKKIIAN